jgi:hypothetical protein
MFLVMESTTKQSKLISNERIVLPLSGLQLIAAYPTAICRRVIKIYSSTKHNSNQLTETDYVLVFVYY